MANAIYTKAKQKFLSAEIDLENEAIMVLLVNGDYTPNLSTDEHLDDIDAGARVELPVEITGKSVTNGVFDGTDTTFVAPDPDNAVTAVVLYQEGAGEATSPLIAYIDTGIGFPTTTNGSDIIVRWDNGTNKILRVV